MSIAKQLIALRTKHGYSQDAVASAIGIKTRTYQNYEYNERDPQLPTLIALAEFYDISLDTLVFGEQSKWNSTKKAYDVS